jgi:hypothetical protein
VAIRWPNLRCENFACRKNVSAQASARMPTVFPGWGVVGGVWPGIPLEAAVVETVSVTCDEDPFSITDCGSTEQPTDDGALVVQVNDTEPLKPSTEPTVHGNVVL